VYYLKIDPMKLSCFRFRLFVAFIFLISLTNSYGQSLAEKYFNLKFSYNPLTINAIDGIYNVTYTNDKGVYPSLYEIVPSYKLNQYNIGLGFGKFKGLNHTIFFEFLKGKIEKGQFGYSIGYNFALEGDKNDFFVRPGVGFMYGNTSLTFEEFNNSNRFINLYGEKYEAKKAKIMQTYTSSVLRPSVTFTYLIKQIFGISVELGYNVDLSKKLGKYEVYFEEFSDADPKLVNNISNKNYIVLNPEGTLAKENIYNLTGFYWSIGISSYKSFDYD